jgi:hypothetical protein
MSLAEMWRKAVVNKKDMKNIALIFLTLSGGSIMFGEPLKAECLA